MPLIIVLHPEGVLAQLVPAGVLLAVALVVLLWRKARNTRLAKLGRIVAGPLVLLWEAQGVFQVGTMIGLPPVAALVGSGVTAAVLTTFAAQAHEHYQRHQVLGPSGRLMWIVAVPMGLIVALSAHSPAEVGLRIWLPVLAALVFKSQYLPDEPKPDDGGRAVRRGSWKWTPRRVGVALGLIDPTDADIDTVHRERQTRIMTDLAHKVHSGSGRGGWLHDRRSARLARLALLADDDMVAEVTGRISRAHRIVALTDPAVEARAVSTTRKTRAPRVATGTGGGDDTETTPAGPRGNGRAGGGASTATRVAKAMEKTPTASPVQIAAKLGLSERTVQRYLADPNLRHPVSREATHAQDTDADTAGISPVNGVVASVATA